MIVEKIQEYLEKQSQRYPCHVNRASEIGHPCERFLVYNRTRWEEKILPDARLQAIFALGNLFEGYAFDLLRKVGMEISEQQVSFYDERTKLSGRLDAIGQWPGDREHRFPIEVKSSSPHIWSKINGPADFNFKFWLMKYPPQLQSYMFFHRKIYEKGMIFLINKSTGWPKEIWFDLDIDYMAQIEEKCHRINKAVELYQTAGDECLPEQITDISICEMCDFRHICRPATDFGSELKISDDPEFDEKLKRLVEGQAQAKEIDALDKEVKARMKATAKDEGATDFKYLTPEVFVRGKMASNGSWRFTFDKVGEGDSE